MRGIPALLLTLFVALGTLSEASAQTPAQQQQLQEAQRLYNQALELQQQGKIEEALPAAAQMVKLVLGVLGENHADTANCIDVVGGLLAQKGDYDGARQFYGEALKIRTNLFGEDHLQTAVSMNNLGTVLQAQGDYPGSQRYREATYRILRNVVGEEHQHTATALDSLASVLQAQGDYAAARERYKQALVIRRKVLGEEHSDTATSYNNLGVILQTQGDYAGARARYEQALAIRKKVLGEEHQATAYSLISMGALLQVQGNFAAARTHLERGEAILKKTLGEAHPDTASAINNLGTLYVEQGDYVAARPYLERALRIRTKVLGEAHPDTASSLSDLGTMLLLQGDYSASRPYLERALEIRTNLFGEEHPTTAHSLMNLGGLLLKQGDYPAAQKYFEQTLAIHRAIHGEEHPETAKSLNNLAALFQLQGDYDAARPPYEQALAIHQKLFGDEHVETARSCNNLATLLQMQGEFASARPYYEQALAIRKKLLGEDHPDTAQSLNNLGHLLHRVKELEAARPYYEQALAIRLKVLGPQHPDTTSSQGNLALLEATAGAWPKARELIDAARRGARDHATKVLGGLSPREQLTFLREIDGKAFQLALSFGFERRTDRAFAEGSATWLLNGKGIAQEVLASRSLLTRDLRDPESKALATQLLEVRRNLANLTLAKAEPDKHAERQEALASLAQEEARLSRELSRRAGPSVASGDWTELDEVRKTLAEDEVLIDIARFQVFDFEFEEDDKKWQPARYVAWIISPAGQGEVQVIDLGPADELDSLIEKARNAISAAAQPDGILKQEGEQAATAALRKDLQQVAERVWQPLSEHLPKQAAHLILSPDGALWLLPWAALPLDEDRFLIEQHAVSYVTSGRDLVRPAGTTSSVAPALFADPDFDLGPETMRESIRAIFPNQDLDNNRSRGTLSQTALPEVQRLPHTELEAQAIAPSVERITGKSPTLYLGRYALESVTKRLQRPQVLVLSTHGFFLPDQRTNLQDQLPGSDTASASLLSADGQLVENPLLRCGLLLAGCNRGQPVGGDDGILTGMEIVGLDLRGTALVVLSACETGIGEIQTGEGVAGLRQAFQLAGAQAVVATLWQVPDRDSAILMNDYFANLADGESKPAGLRQAQLKRIQTRRERYGAAHPFFWAAWTATGRN